jgi:hypothetical protein
MRGHLVNTELDDRDTHSHPPRRFRKPEYSSKYEEPDSTKGEPAERGSDASGDEAEDGVHGSFAASWM